MLSSKRNLDQLAKTFQPAKLNLKKVRTLSILIQMEVKMVINWINALKGIGIILVVLGHLLAKDYPFVTPYIYMFHMPLFFFISGYLFKPDLNFRSYFIKKFFSFGIPYLSFLFILFLSHQYS